MPSPQVRNYSFPPCKHYGSSCERTIQETMQALASIPGPVVDPRQLGAACQEVYGFMDEFDAIIRSGDSIMEAIRRTRHSGRILVCPGVYKESLVLDKDVYLDGQGKATLLSEEGVSAVSVSASVRASVGGFVLRVEGDGISAVTVMPGASLALRQVDVSSKGGTGVRVEVRPRSLFNLSLF